jgi:hypothetical protein
MSIRALIIDHRPETNPSFPWQVLFEFERRIDTEVNTWIDQMGINPDDVMRPFYYSCWFRNKSDATLCLLTFKH